jgi:hypothetical protein
LKSSSSSGLEHRERLLAGAGDGAADAHLALDDEIEPVPRLALVEDVLARLEALLATDFGDACELALVQVLEERDGTQQRGGGVGHGRG